AGPGVILSYAVGAAIALALMWALAEMAVTHPVAGSFGVYAEVYLHPWAGFVMRYSYWLGQVVAIGSEVVAAAIYCRYWFPGVPAWIWVAAFSASLVYVNAQSVASFGWFEYWFAMIKVVTIILFLILGAALLLGIGFKPIGTTNFTAHGGFLPNGWLGVGLGIAMAIFSYLGIEVVAVTSGEARDPQVAVPRALRKTLLRLARFYVGGIAVLVGGTPVHALLVSSAGMFAALLLEHFLQQSTYLYMLGAAFFGGLFVWMMIFVTHLAFRRRHAQDMASPGAASGARRSPGPEVSRGK